MQGWSLRRTGELKRQTGTDPPAALGLPGHRQLLARAGAKPPSVLSSTCTGGSSRLLRCLAPGVSGGFQVPPHQQTCSGTKATQLRHLTHLLTQDVTLSVSPNSHRPSTPPISEGAVVLPPCRWVGWSLLFPLLKI